MNDGIRNLRISAPIDDDKIQHMNQAAIATLIAMSLERGPDPFAIRDLVIVIAHAAGSVSRTISGVRVIRPTSPNRFE